MIVRPITQDGLVGYDQRGQLMLCAVDALDDSRTYRGIRDVRDKTCALCLHGWDTTGPAMSDQCFWTLIEETVHESCLVRHDGFVERQEFFSALVGARIRFRGLATIPNGYWSSDRSAAKPWYTAELIDYPAHFVLGWRKRVAHVELVADGPENFSWFENAKEQCAQEDVTKWFEPRRVGLHAWGTIKIKAYIHLLGEVSGYNHPKEKSE